MNLYFDNAATTKVCDEAIKAIHEMVDDYYGNPSSKHFEGLHVEEKIEKARKFFAKEIGCTKDELYFTSGGTEGNNIAVFGTAKGYRRDGDHIIVSPIEHPSVGTAVSMLEDEGFRVTQAKVNSHGFINIDDLIEQVQESTIMVSIMHVNNEIGSIQDIATIGKKIKEKNPSALFHVDGVQGFMKFPLNVKQAKVDIYTASSHKIKGPKGSGFIYVRSGLKVKPLFYGGSQQKGLRPGTENVPGIIGFYEAGIKMKQDLFDRYKKVLELKKHLIKGIGEELPNWKVNSPESNGEFEEECSSPYIVSLRTESLKGEVMLHGLEDYKICVSTGSACSSKKLNVSHVLKSLGLSDEENDKSIRISFSPDQTIEDVDQLVNACKAVDLMFGRFIKK